ncbi:MAG: hypothetical protein LQ346_008183 [Caloplaca aetnensis]|nr:MAG: hypothetical protein LQ346_008183 [Caloplaca aetnensis]
MDPAADSLSPASIAYPTLAFIALVFDIPPLVWHAKNRNVAACNLISWTILTNLMNFVNALIWPTDNIAGWFPGYVLCDIEAKLILAATMGIAGSLACIMRALAKVLDTEHTVIIPTRKQRYQNLIITSILCFGGPIYIILIHYVVQPSRFEKHHTSTTVTTLASPIESEKLSQAQNATFMTGADNSFPPVDHPTAGRPLPPVPAQSKPSWLRSCFARNHDPSSPDDIESALERYDNHRRNRYIAGLWHVNNAESSAPVSATQGMRMGNCNGLRL